MNRKIFDVLPEFEGRKEFIDNVMDENGKDIEKAKGDSTSVTKALEEAKNEITTLKATISDLEKSKDDVAELQKTIDSYKEKEKKAEAEKQKQVFEANMRARFDNLVKDSEFVNEFTKDGAYGKFKELVADKANEGKGDADIYAEIIKGNDSWFKPKHQFSNMNGLDNYDAKLVDVEAFKKMPLIQQMAFANNHPNEYAELSKLI